MPFQFLAISFLTFCCKVGIHLSKDKIEVVGCWSWWLWGGGELEGLYLKIRHSYPGVDELSLDKKYQYIFSPCHNLRMNLFLQILGICFAQNLRADIFAQVTPQFSTQSTSHPLLKLSTCFGVYYQINETKIYDGKTEIF